MKVSVLGDCLRSILNAERAGKKQVLIRPASKVIIKFLKVMQKHSKFTNHISTLKYSTKDYIGEFELIDDHRSNKIVIELLGRLNKCGVISPRFDVKNHVFCFGYN